MRKRTLLVLMLLLAAPVQAATVQTAPMQARSTETAALTRISGEIHTRERMALPADATLTVELIDTTPDARSGRLARLALSTRGRQVPLAFELPVHSADLNAARTYQLRATLINGGGELLFSGVQTLTGETTRRVNLRLARAGEQRADATLEDTYWKLLEVDGQSARVQPGEREAHLLLLDGLASGGSGCNKMMGRYTLGTRGHLAIGPLASTRMACAPALMAQESTLHAAFARTTRYRIDGNVLELREGDVVLARFVARAIQ